MAGFAVNLRLLHANPQATVPELVSYLEDGFLRQLHLELDQLEPLASGCTEVSPCRSCVCGGGGEGRGEVILCKQPSKKLVLPNI